MSLADSPAAPFSAANSRIAWVHPPAGFLGLSLLNGLLRILTLGVYHFWGKTEVRQRIWSAVRVDGEPLEYRGTGSELFRGFLIVFFFILLPLALITFLVPLLWGTKAADRGILNRCCGSSYSRCGDSAFTARAATGSRARAGAASARGFRDGPRPLPGPICGPPC